MGRFDPPSEPALEDIGMRAIRPEGIRAHVKFLADDLLEGRGPGTRGFNLATNYVAAQFEAMGLEPAGDIGTFFQPIRFRSASAVPEKTVLAWTRNAQEIKLSWGDDYYSSGELRNPDSFVTGQVVYVGYGITAPEFGIDDFKGLSIDFRKNSEQWQCRYRCIWSRITPNSRVLT